MTYSIVKDTIMVYDCGAPIYSVSALVTTGTREEGQYVNVMWNQLDGNPVLQNLLIDAYDDLFTNPTVVLQGQIRDQIGTVMEPAVPEPTETNMVINATNVTVNEVTP